MNFKFLLPLAAAASFGMGSAASALTITEYSGDLAAFGVVIDEGTRTITIRETWDADTGPFVILQFDDFDFGLASWTVNKYVTNNTGVAIDTFTHELLVEDLAGSVDDDGLSFAQRGIPLVDRTSDTFASVEADELEDRDFLIFFDGTLADGATALFTYGLTDRRAEANPFFLRQGEVLAAIPEPATWGMMIAGFGMVGFAMRRRRTTLGSVAA